MNESKGRIDVTLFPQGLATADQLSNFVVIVSEGCLMRRFSFIGWQPSSPGRKGSDRDCATAPC